MLRERSTATLVATVRPQVKRCELLYATAVGTDFSASLAAESTPDELTAGGRRTTIPTSSSFPLVSTQ
jgi:hypothetical protein